MTKEQILKLMDAEIITNAVPVDKLVGLSIVELINGGYLTYTEDNNWMDILGEPIVVELEPVVEPSPIAEPEPVVEPVTIVEPSPIAEPEPVVEPVTVAEPEPEIVVDEGDEE